MTKILDRILQRLKSELRIFFEPMILGWAKLEEPDKLVILAGLCESIFGIATLKLGLFTRHFEVVVGISMGILFGLAFYFNKVQPSLAHTKETKQQD